MADIPEDVMNTASVVIDELTVLPYEADRRERIANAILAERGRHKAEIARLRALLNKAATKLENCRYSELPLAKELRTALAQYEQR